MEKERRRESERKQGEEGRREGGLKEEENNGMEGGRSDEVYLGGGWGDRKGRSEGGRERKWRGAKREIEKGRRGEDVPQNAVAALFLSLIQRHQLCPVCTCVQCLSHHI